MIVAKDGLQLNGRGPDFAPLIVELISFAGARANGNVPDAQKANTQTNRFVVSQEVQMAKFMHILRRNSQLP